MFAQNRSKLLTDARIIKIIFSIIILQVSALSFAVPTYSYSRGHTFYSGIVDSITQNFISASGKTFKLQKKPKVYVHFKKNNTIMIKPAQLSEVSKGSKVTLKIFSGKVIEIFIERY